MIEIIAITIAVIIMLVMLWNISQIKKNSEALCYGLAMITNTRMLTIKYELVSHVYTLAEAYKKAKEEEDYESCKIIKGLIEELNKTLDEYEKSKQ